MTQIDGNRDIASQSSTKLIGRAVEQLRPLTITPKK